MTTNSADVLDAVVERHLAVLGKTGSGKTYAAKGIVERLLQRRRRVCIVDPTGVWWGLKATAEGGPSKLPVAVLGGDHGDLPLEEGMGEGAATAAVRLPIALVLDLSLMTHAARTRFLTDFLAALFRLNRDVLHLVLDEADEAAPQSPLPETRRLFGEVDRIVRRGRARGFRVIAITQRPAALHKHVLSQADTLIALKLVAPQDLKAVEEWIKGQADVEAGREVLDSLAKLEAGAGWIWAPEQGVLRRMRFPPIATYDSGRTPDGTETLPTITPATVDLAALAAALGSEETAERARGGERKEAHQLAGLQRALEDASARIAALEAEVEALRSSEGRLRERLAQVARIAWIDGPPPAKSTSAEPKRQAPGPDTEQSEAEVRSEVPLHPAARKLLSALAQHAPARFTWGQAATLAGLKPSGGHFNAGRKELRDRALVEEGDGCVAITDLGLAEAGERAPAPSSPAERLDLWCARLPSPAPQMLRYLAAQGHRFVTADELAQALAKKPTGGHWNFGIALLRNNGLIEVDGRRYRAAELLQLAGRPADQAPVAMSLEK
jgi:hypothetical protein